LKQIVVIYCKSIFCLNTTPFRGFLLQTLHLFLYNYNSLSVASILYILYIFCGFCVDCTVFHHENERVSLDIYYY
jgi:hypothetical protein